MTPSNLWALIIGLFVVGGAVVGGVVWHQNHPDAPAQLSRLVEPLVPKITEKLAPPPAAPPKPEPAKPEPSQQATRAEPPAAQTGKSAPPQFDVVRVEPSGDAVFAGKSDPNAMVALVEGGKVVAATKADPAGNFVMLPPALKPGAHDLSLQQSADGKPAANSKQNVAISIPKQKSGQVVVALAEPGKPTKLLSSPPKAPAPATANAPPPAAQKPAGSQVAVAKPETAVAPPAAVAPKGPDLAFRTVELESGNGFFATGVATPGTKIELYLNGAHLAEVTAGNDGQWSVTIKKGLAGGHYGVRADAIGADRKVVARAEVPFDVPVAMAAPMKAPPGPAKVAPSEAQQAAEARKAAEAEKAAEAKRVAEARSAEAARQAAEKAAEAQKVAEMRAADARKAEEARNAEAARQAAAAAAAAQKAAAADKIAAERRAAEAQKAADARKAAEARAAALRTPPNPSTLAELKSQSLAGPPKGDIQPAVPAPRPDIAAAAKATVQAAPGKAPPTLAMAPPARTTGPDAVPMPTPPRTATAPQTAPARMAVAPAKPADAPPVIASTKPAIAPPKRPEVAVAVGAKPAGSDESVPFAAQEESRQEPKQQAGQGGNAANAVIQEVETALVVPGDNLWNISRAKLGNATRYTQIYAANVSQIRNPDLIYPGQVFVMPQ